MRKRFISFFVVIAMAVGACVNCVTADDVKQVFAVTLQNDQTSGYIRDEEISLKVTGAQNSPETRVYQICCAYQGVEENRDISLASGASSTQYISLAAKQGACELQVTVRYQGAAVYQKNFSFTVIKPYQPQFMEQISKKGINGVEKSNIDYFKLMGLQTARNGYEWGWTEKKKGVYDWPGVHADVIGAGINPVFLCCYGNELYNGGKADKTGPSSKNEIDAFAKYVTEAAKKYPQIKYFEVWNEPNISFWLPEPNIYDYMNLLEVVNQELKKEDEKNVIIGGSMAVSDFAFTEKLFDLDASAAMDAFSVHPYCYPGASDIYVKTQLEEFERKVLKHGGWQIKVSTEFGFPTNTGDRGISVDRQAKEIVKHFAITDDNDYEINQIYRMDDLAINGSHDNSFNEDNFGVVYYDKTPKPAVTAIKTMAEMTNGGLPLGRLEAPYGVSCYFYIKDGGCTGILWRNERTNAATPQHLSFDVDVSYYDMNGNLLGTGRDVPVTDAPVYIKGIPGDTAAKELRQIVKSKFDDKVRLLDGFDAIPGYAQMKDLLYSGLNYCTYSAMPDEAAARNNLESYYKNVLGEMIALYKNGTFAGNTEQLASLLYIAHLGGLRLMDLYMLCVDTGCDEATVQSAQTKLAGAKEATRNNARGGTLVNAENIYKFAAEMNENLMAVCNTQEVNPMKDGMKKGWSLMVSCLAETAEKMSGIERVTHHNILVQLPSSEQSFTLGETKNTNVSLYNYTDAEITGTMQVLDPANGLAGVSEEVSVAPGQSMCVPVPVLFDKEFGPEEMLKLRFIENGGVQKTKEAPFALDITGSAGTDFTTYTADDFDAAAEKHEYQWMYSTDDEKYYVMDSACEKTYKTSTIDKNRYIACQVTPIYADGSKGTPKLQKKGVITSLKTVPCTSIPAEERAKTKTTPPEYKFRLKGSSREYVLLDVFHGETESKYYVLSDFLTANLEQHNLDPQNINPADKDSIGYWLNTTYVNQGYSLAGVSWPKLEEELYRYIDKNHTWYVEAGITGEDNSNKRGYAYTAGIGLLTETEAVKYLGRYGWNIKTENGDWYNPWLLATGNADTNQYIIVMNFKVGDDVQHSGQHTIVNATPGSGHGEMYARPAFYLNDNFFKCVGLDVDSMGAHVKEIILENYTKNEMARIYSESELEKIGYAANPAGIKNFTSKDGTAYAKVEIPDDACTPVIAIYDAGNTCIGVKIMENSESAVSFAREAKKIKAFYWSGFREMKPVYPLAMQEKTADWQ